MKHVRRLWPSHLQRLHLVTDLLEVDFSFFLGAPLPGTCKGSNTSLMSSQSASGACGSTGPYILPSFAPTFGRIILASWRRAPLSRSYPSVEWDAEKDAARLILRRSRYLSRVAEYSYIVLFLIGGNALFASLVHLSKTQQSGSLRFSRWPNTKKMCEHGVPSDSNLRQEQEISFKLLWQNHFELHQF